MYAPAAEPEQVGYNNISVSELEETVRAGMSEPPRGLRLRGTSRETHGDGDERIMNKRQLLTTSTSSEGSFSLAGRTLEERRGTLSEQSVDGLLLLRGL
jgi:hypothetical protein